MANPGKDSAQSASREPPNSAPLIRVVAMPADANPNGDIFGGWLLAQMDLAGGNLAVQRARGRCATVAVDGMVFHEPVFVGDEVSCYGEVIRTGRTSITTRIEAWRRNLFPARYARSPKPSLPMSRSATTAVHGHCSHYRSTQKADLRNGALPDSRRVRSVADEMVSRFVPTGAHAHAGG